MWAHIEPDVERHGGGLTEPPADCAKHRTGQLVPTLLGAAVVLLAGILALLAARLSGHRAECGSRPPTPQAARIQAEPQPGPPAAVRIRFTG